MLKYKTAPKCSLSGPFRHSGVGRNPGAVGPVRSYNLVFTYPYQHCPEEFREKARKLLLAMRGRASGWDSTIKTAEGLRQVLLKFIADFANWDNSARDEYLETGRGLVQAAHPEETPLVVDPFAGGGSIPLEALRLGCEAFASDLNPVACLILKVMLDDIPRHGPGLGRRTPQGRSGNQGSGRKGAWPASTPRTQTGPHPSPTSGPAPCAAKRPTAARRYPLMRSLWLCKEVQA